MVDVDAQKVVEHLGREIARLTVEKAVLQAQVEALQEALDRRVEQDKAGHQ